jgi:hypothetical protein
LRLRCLWIHRACVCCFSKRKIVFFERNEIFDKISLFVFCCTGWLYVLAAQHWHTSLSLFLSTLPFFLAAKAQKKSACFFLSPTARAQRDTSLSPSFPTASLATYRFLLIYLSSHCFLQQNKFFVRECCDKNLPGFLLIIIPIALFVSSLTSSSLPSLPSPCLTFLLLSIHLLFSLLFSFRFFHSYPFRLPSSSFHFLSSVSTHSHSQACEDLRAPWLV